MMMIKNRFIWMLGLSLAITSCDVNNELPIIKDDNDTPEVPFIQGDADFSKFIAVGASFTAGFNDNALFIETQKNSFPNILAEKFANVGGGTFTEPLMNDNIGGLLLAGNVIQNPRLYFDGSGPTLLDATPTTEVTTPFTGDASNYGIPGAKSYHLVAEGYGSLQALQLGKANPYFARYASSENTSVLADVMAKQPTFFTLIDVGGNDVLGYALAGGGILDGEQATNQTGNLDVSTYGTWDISDPNFFTSVYTGIVNTLTSIGAKGVVGTLPYVTTLSHFTTVPYNAVPLDAATASLVNSSYETYNGGIQQAFAALVQAGAFTQEQADAEIAKRTINFVEGNNAVVIVDEALTDLGALNPTFAALPQYRQATAEDLLVLTSSSFIGTLADENNPLSVNGVAIPLADKWVLTPEEQEEVKVATDAYNTVIENIATNYDNIILVDFKAVMEEAATTGIEFDDYVLTPTFVTGGLISLDGVHLTSRGYALMANKILEAIDTNFGFNFTEATNGLAKADNYPTNYSPTLR